MARARALARRWRRLGLHAARSRCWVSRPRVGAASTCRLPSHTVSQSRRGDLRPGRHLASSAPSASPVQGPGGPTGILASSGVWVTWGQLSTSRLSTTGCVVWGGGEGGRGHGAGGSGAAPCTSRARGSLSPGLVALTVCALSPGHETSTHGADPDGGGLLPQTPPVRGLRRSPEAGAAAVADS